MCVLLKFPVNLLSFSDSKDIINEWSQGREKLIQNYKKKKRDVSAHALMGYKWIPIGLLFQAIRGARLKRGGR